MGDLARLLNTIWQQSDATYQARIPQATRENITEVGSAVMSNPTTQNTFISSLVNKIALTQVHLKQYNNPLKILKKNRLPYGEGLEEIYTNPATGTVYDPSSTGLLSSATPDTKVIYHHMNRQSKYKTQVKQAQLMQAFHSWDGMLQVINQIVTALYSGDEIDEYTLMKNLVVSGISGCKITTLDVNKLDGTIEKTKDLVRAIRTVSKMMTFARSDFNSYYTINQGIEGVTKAITWTPKEDQVLLLRADIAANIDLDLLAFAFNMDKAQAATRVIEVDDFGNNEDTYAVLCDDALFQVRDTLEKMETPFHNPDLMSDTFYWHHWQMMSLSLFANAVCFKGKDTQTA